ncbi:hypothetical protein [Xanthomonas sp. LMG 12461]|uniref:hypothetical protein n=1 Tax=Xanthomonas sp. LMG 12461 TaxID=2014543 RepID=UPI001265142A|nr:hypothetical protein [Xanthomonas sp. LMG 12461]
MSSKVARQQARELAWLNLARAVMPEEIPDGVVEQPQPPAPDFLIRSDGTVFGIEVTQLFQCDDPALRLQPREIEPAQHNIVDDARSLYESSYGHRLFVNVLFNGAPPEKKPAVRELVALVHKHRPETGEMFQALDARSRALLPWWIEGLTICEQEPDEPSQWIGGSVWSTPDLTHDMLQAAVSIKNENVDSYLACCDQVWLLVICDLWPMAASLSIPRSATEWQLESRFARVLLVSRDDKGISF